MPANSEDYMLTTVDNPWNPFTNYAEWYQFDQQAGYDTPGYLARIANCSLDLSDADLDSSIGSAIDEIVDLNINGLYKKAVRPEAA
jgi:hypothetical protein